MTERYLEDFAVGQVFGSGRLVVDEERIKSFAAEFDPQPFHLDEEGARNTVFRGLAASGWHTAALTMRLLVESDLKPAGGIVGAGFDEFRWPRPVRPGDELRLESEVLEVRPSKSRPEQGLIKVRTTTLNQNADAVQILIANLVVPRRPGLAADAGCPGYDQRGVASMTQTQVAEMRADQRPSAIVVGVGAEQGLGAALCRRFAAEGYHVFVAGRTSRKIDKVAQTIAGTGGSAEAIVTDTTSEGDVARLFEVAMAPRSGLNPIDLVAYNAGNNQRIDFRETTAGQFEDFWRVGCFGGFLVGREAARRLVPLGRGTVIFTGASASLRGKPG